MPPPTNASQQDPRPLVSSGETDTDVLVLLALPEGTDRLQESLQQLSAEITWELLAGETALRALSASWSARAIVCDLALLPEACHPDAAVILLVSPGEEDRAAEWLHKVPVCVLLKSGRYERLVPALIEQAVRAQRYREEFGHYLRHEINNPLTGILVNAELLLDSTEGFSAAIRKRLQTIIDQSIGLRKLVRAIGEKIPLGGAPSAKGQRDETELP